jgi:hypothetical protein
MVMKLQIEGLDKVKKKLEDLQSRACNLHGSHQVPAGELLSPDFMRHHTRFTSFEAMATASGFKVESSEDFTAIPDAKWDAFIRAATPFAGWQAMLGAAGQEWAARKLGLK